MSKQFSVWFIWFGPHNQQSDKRPNWPTKTNKRTTSYQQIVTTYVVKHTKNIHWMWIRPMQMCDNTQWVVCGHNMNEYLCLLCVVYIVLSLSSFFLFSFAFSSVVHAYVYVFHFRQTMNLTVYLHVLEIKIGQYKFQKRDEGGMDGRRDGGSETHRESKRDRNIEHVIRNNKPVKWNRLAIMYDTLSVFQLIQTVI